ncbi:hypothetical protein B0H14DRAFT_2565236 [Mycena olivaceomarginata]|nr:hypothetical protein B0H14DRAFT_2565236 [Mycena olivaceomarginata]
MYRPPPPAADVVRPAITYFLGCWDIATCFNFMLQGVLFAQIAHYTALYENDALLLRAFVAGLSIITTAKTAQGLVFLWTINVDHFMDVVAAISFTTSWMSSLGLLLVSAIAFFVQLFFCIRLWWISKNVYIVLLIVTLFVVALIAVRHSKYASPETSGILSALVRLAFQAYAISAMWTLNSRKKIRRAHLIGPQNSSTTTGHQTPNDLELSSVWVSYVESDSNGAQMQNPTTLNEESKHSVATAGIRSS